MSVAIALCVVLALVFGWLDRASNLIDPEHGIGYALGVTGSVMMLVLLAYPIRKRVRRAPSRVGSVGFWFRFHMVLGLFGPLAILYHCRFSWGALNSSVALGSMIIVASSGLVGRFLYSRVHRGYSGRKLEMRALRQEMDEVVADLEEQGVLGPEVIAGLHAMEDRATRAGATFWTSARAVIGLGLETRRVEREIRQVMHVASLNHEQDLAPRLAHFFEAVRRAAEYAFYDRLLRLWHLLHLPLFVLLVGAVILHIVAVHMY